MYIQHYIQAKSDHSDLVSRRMGFIPLPLTCLVNYYSSSYVHKVLLVSGSEPVPSDANGPIVPYIYNIMYTYISRRYCHTYRKVICKF